MVSTVYTAKLSLRYNCTENTVHCYTEKECNTIHKYNEYLRSTGIAEFTVYVCVRHEEGTAGAVLVPTLPG